MSQFITKFVSAARALESDESGATAVEYGLLVALIAAVIILVVQALGQQIAAAFQSVVDALGAVI